MINNEKYLKVAVRAAREAGPVFKKHFGKAKDVQMKNGNFRDLVTQTDKQIENQTRKLILKNFPKHKIIGEEHAKDLVEKNDLVWIIDPIDGTTNYIQGLPFCCISIALWDKKGPLVAAVYAPVSNQLFTAIRGQGAKLNSKPIHTTKVNKLDHALGGVGWLKVNNGINLFSKIIKSCRKLRFFASSALQTCLVGSGNFDFQVTNDIHIWDFAAAILIVQEAGGVVTDIKGKKINIKTHDIIASNGKIHKELLKTIK